MTIKDRINEDLKTAMKASDELRRETLRSLRAGMIEAERKGTLHELSDDEVLGILNAAVKRRRETIDQLAQANRPEMVEREKQEMAIIMEYLPAQMDEAAVAAVIDGIIAATGAAGAKDFGKVMGAAVKELKGKTDGSVIQRIVKERLGS